ncbi:SIMPL domain-containing protein [Candidatus Peregrinibacteria bacterium]|nr:SIMPL domain-containing protein [Candidatus Peregrinibacteria bacterium]
MKKLKSQLGIIVTTVALCLNMAPLAFAGEMPLNGSYLSVTGEGHYLAEADKATVNLTIESIEKNAREARAKNKQVYAELKTALVALGIDQKDIKLDYYGGYPNFEYQMDNSKKQTSYTSSYSVSIQLKDLSKVDAVLDKVNDFETVNLMGTSYLLENNEEAMDKAREKAVQDTQKRAQKLAKAFGKTLGSLSNVSESSYSNIGYSAAGGQTTAVDVIVTLYASFEISK